MEAEKIKELKGFVEYCKQNPHVLNTPSLAFFKNFMQSFGARIPAFGGSGKDGEDHEDISNDDIVESDVELDNSDIVEPDNDPPQKMGDSSVEVTEVYQEAAQLSKAKAMEAIADGKLSEAIDYLTKAIMLNPNSAILYGNRAIIFVKLKKPNAAIRDADVAIQINPDSAKGYKARGLAKAMLGSWEEAARDLHVASKLDFDEEIGLALKMVEPNAKKIEEHNQKYERLRKEKELRRLERKMRQMGDSSVEVTEENQEAAQLSKAKAMEAVADGKLSEALDYLTEAIMLNPNSAILYGNRASIFIKLKKPNAAIRDADVALLINPDSAKGYKARGLAKAMLGSWEEAARDLHVASKLDFDEEIGLALKKVEPNAKKIEEHNQKYERLRKEKELRRIELERKMRQDAEAASVLKDGEIIPIHSGSELEEKLNAASKTSRLSVLYFTTTWWGPCCHVSPVFTSLAGKYPKVVFLKVDIDEARDAAAEWNISSIPAFFFVRNGKEVDQLVGADKNALEQKIAQHA